MYPGKLKGPKGPYVEVYIGNPMVEDESLVQSKEEHYVEVTK